MYLVNYQLMRNIEKCTVRTYKQPEMKTQRLNAKTTKLGTLSVGTSLFSLSRRIKRNFALIIGTCSFIL